MYKRRIPCCFPHNSVCFRIGLSQIHSPWIRSQNCGNCPAAKTKQRGPNICSPRLILIDPRKWQYPKTGLLQHAESEARSHQVGTNPLVLTSRLKVISDRMAGKKRTPGGMMDCICIAQLLSLQQARQSLGRKFNKLEFRQSY
jgi:hypothetical protein